MNNRKLIVRTAQSYYESARGLNTDGEIYATSEKLFNMGEALNHTESALHYACCLLEQYMKGDFTDDSLEEFDEEIKKFLSNMRYKQE